ncbi:GntR family transcriptional regulator [Paracoccus versutus]|uniref:GntR family transcriptional regulator n=1 Tax=Paracoccus versutus TaxID=34007 RepID=UPI000DF75297|nr:GntR family transcriptional regulator [Paracoccus versutus]RDD69857.1 GntR family transcriptional regulator [Paracoccus versutus]
MSSGRSRTLESVRQGILHGDWFPGQRLQPMDLAKRFETSTTVIREALSLLVGDGLVVARPNQGFFVPDLNLRELRDITELRCRTEELGAQLAAERGDLDWEAELTGAHHRLVRIPRRLAEDPARINPEWSLAHHAFHQTIIAGSGSQQIVQVAANLSYATVLYRCWAAPHTGAAGRDVEAEHRALLEAALAHDGPKLGALLRAHYEATLDVVLEAGLGLPPEKYSGLK